MIAELRVPLYNQNKSLAGIGYAFDQTILGDRRYSQAFCRRLYGLVVIGVHANSMHPENVRQNTPRLQRCPMDMPIVGRSHVVVYKRGPFRMEW